MNSFSRKLSPSENMYMDPKLGGSILVFIARIEGSITPEVVKQALRLIQKRHLMLQTHIVESANGAYFQSEGTPDIPLRVVDRQYESQWVDVAEEEAHQKFSVDMGPLCRITCLHSSAENTISEIIAVFHHVICDALSGLQFIDQLLKYCQQIMVGEPICDVATIASLPPLEQLYNSNSSGGNMLTRKFNQLSFLAEMMGIFKKPKLIIESQADPGDRRTHFLARHLSQELTTALKNRCKQESTTVHGALCAAMLFGAAKVARVDTPTHFSCASSVSLRKYCEPEVPEDYMACLADGVGHVYTLDKNTDFWDLARETKSRISHSLKHGALFMSFVSADSSQPSDRPKKTWEPPMGRITTIRVANAGQIKISTEYANVQLKEIYCLDSVHMMGPCFGVNVVTLHEQMFCTFPYVTPLLRTQTINFFVNSVMYTLETVCQSQLTTLSCLPDVEENTLQPCYSTVS